MDETQNTEGLSRRTVVKAAAWSVPVLALGSAAPAMAASPCEFEVLPGSFKCCNGPVKNMKLVLRPTGGCAQPGDLVCVTKICVDTGGGTCWEFPGATACGSTTQPITVYLPDASNCSVNLRVEYTVNNGPTLSTEIKSDNIPNGNTDADCIAPAAAA